MKTWFPSVLAAVLAILTAFAPSLQHFVSGHPALAAVFAGVYAILTHLLPSPLAPMLPSPRPPNP